MSEKNKSQKLLSYSEFNELISEKGKVNDAAYKKLLNKLKDSGYVTKNNKIRIDKLIGDGQFGDHIRNINTQILSKAAENIFDFGKGIVIDEKLGCVLAKGSIKSLDDCVKEMKTAGGKLYYNADEDPDGQKICSVFRKQNNGDPLEFRFSTMEFNSLKNANIALELVPNLKFVFNGFTNFGANYYSYHIFEADSIQDVSKLLDKGVKAKVIKELLQRDSKAFAKDAFAKFKDAGISCQKTKVQVTTYGYNEKSKEDEKITKTENRMQFLITDANKLAEYDGGKLKGLLELGIDYFTPGSIKDITYFLNNGNGMIYDRLNTALHFYAQETIFDEKVLNELKNAEGCELKQIQVKPMTYVLKKGKKKGDKDAYKKVEWTENRFKFEITDANALVNYDNGKLKNLLNIGLTMFSDNSLKNVQELLKKGMSDYWISYLIKYVRDDVFTTNAFDGIPGVSFENKKFLITDANKLKNTEFKFLLEFYKDTLREGHMSYLKFINRFSENAITSLTKLLERKDELITIFDRHVKVFSNDVRDKLKEAGFQFRIDKPYYQSLIANAKTLVSYEGGKLKSLLNLSYLFFGSASIDNIKHLFENGMKSSVITNCIQYNIGAFTKDAFKGIPGVSFKNKKFLITDADKLKNTEYEFLLELGDSYYAKEKNKVVTCKNPESEKDQTQKIDDKITTNLDGKNKSDGDKNKKSDQNIIDVKDVKNGSKNIKKQAVSEVKRDSQAKIKKGNDKKNKKSGQNIKDVKNKVKIVEQKVISETKNMDSQIEVEHEASFPLDHNKITGGVPQNTQEPESTTNQSSAVTTQVTSPITKINQPTEKKQNNDVNKSKNIYDVDIYLSETDFDTTNLKDKLKDIYVTWFDKLCVIIYMLWYNRISNLFTNKKYSVETHAKLRKAYGDFKNQNQDAKSTQSVHEQLNSMSISNDQKKNSVYDLLNCLQPENRNVPKTSDQTNVKQ